jgi:hypothetical protein
LEFPYNQQLSFAYFSQSAERTIRSGWSGFLPDLAVGICRSMVPEAFFQLSVAKRIKPITQSIFVVVKRSFVFNP